MKTQAASLNNFVPPNGQCPHDQITTRPTLRKADKQNNQPASEKRVSPTFFELIKAENEEKSRQKASSASEDEDERPDDITIFQFISSSLSNIWKTIISFSFSKLFGLVWSVFVYLFGGIFRRFRCDFCSKFTGTVFFALFIATCCLGYVLDVSRQNLENLNPENITL